MPGSERVKRLAERHYLEGVRMRRATDRAAAALWRRVKLTDLSGSWVSVIPLLRTLLTDAQRKAASNADDYVSGALAAEGLSAETAGEVIPSALAGVASDGRPIDSLLYSPVTTVKSALLRGASGPQALSSGLSSLLMITGTQVADAGRVADSIAIVTRPRVGYVRMLSVPSCPRCVILAGKWFRWNQGFQRHPRCDCRHIPAPEDMSTDLRTDPMGAFRAGQIRGLTRAERKAVEDGSDLAQVINAKRKGLSTTPVGGRSIRTTREGTGRITPEQIYRDATSRQDAVRLLKLHGYIL